MMRSMQTTREASVIGLVSDFSVRLLLKTMAEFEEEWNSASHFGNISTVKS